MEKQYKPVPKCKALKYKGTPKKPDIKIFVSHRIDLDSETIDNPLYIPVRCGAVYDERKDVKMLGDDTGDNISEKRMDFCEFTVMYWAWKNIQADYYGLCHYRRYLSFANQEFEEWNEQRFYYEEKLNVDSVKKHGLMSSKQIKNQIKEYDVVTSITYQAKDVPIIPPCNTVQELFANHPALLTSNEVIDKVSAIIKRKFTQYYDCFQEELNSNSHRGFNCFVMRKDVFNLFCEYLFGVLFEAEKIFDRAVTKSNDRELGYIGEIIYGSFIRWLKAQEIYKIDERHITLFWNTERQQEKNIIRSQIPMIKQIMRRVFPAYRCSLRIEEKLQQQQVLINTLYSQLASISSEISHMSQRQKCTFWVEPKSFDYNTDAHKLSFWRGYPKATGDLRIIQEANTALLHRLQDICQNLNISFWLHGGSLIGGLRHDGFVPWDDDIDIAMMREDFLKLKQYLHDSEVYAISEYYYLGIGARPYRFNRTDIESNCFVDIFLYDHYELKNSESIIDWRNLTQKKAQLIKMAEALCKELNSYPQEPTLQGHDELKSALDKLFARYIHRTQGPSNSKYLVWGMDNNYEDPNAYAWNHGRIFRKEDIFPLQECSFEGRIYHIPNNYEKYAYAEYGVRYVEMPNNLGESIHWRQYFSKNGAIDHAKELIQKEQENQNESCTTCRWFRYSNF